MNRDQVLNVGMRIYATINNEPHFKFGEEFEIVDIKEWGIILDHCGCRLNSPWSSFSIRTSFELIQEAPLTQEEMARAVSLPNPEEALKFFKR